MYANGTPMSTVHSVTLNPRISVFQKAFTYSLSCSSCTKACSEKLPSSLSTLLLNSVASGYSTKKPSSTRQMSVRNPQGHHLIFMMQLLNQAATTRQSMGTSTCTLSPAWKSATVLPACSSTRISGPASSWMR